MNRQKHPSNINFLVVIPAYNEEASISDVVRRVVPHCQSVVVIDDGSRDMTSQKAKMAGAVVLRHPVNRGKGFALHKGFAYAMAKGADAVITMDADGQHNPDDVPAFLERYSQRREPILIGNRMHNPGAMPWLRFITNWFLSWLLSWTMKQDVPDTQNGLRLYSVEVLHGLAVKTPRFAAESEILLTLARRGIPITSLRVACIYKNEMSGIQPLRDTARFIRMYLRVVLMSHFSADC